MMMMVAIKSQTKLPVVVVKFACGYEGRFWVVSGKSKRSEDGYPWVLRNIPNQASGWFVGFNFLFGQRLHYYLSSW
jgi:hypothetical protein